MLTLELEEVKNRLRVDHDFDDDEIEGLIQASEQEIQGAEVVMVKQMLL